MFKNNSLLNTTNPNFYFWLFILIHTALWTIGPALFRASVTHDTLEGITWGLQWQLGYNKHPFLTAWLCAAVTQVFGSVGWPVYFLAQLAVLTTFYAAWKLAQSMLPPVHALIAALSLEGVFFYNINSFNLTPDTLQSPLWALLALFFYRALMTQNLRNWLLVGLVGALGVCTKYQIALLFLPMIFLCIFNPQARKSFQQKEFYFGLTLFLLLITPHLIWLYQHHFITLIYALNASSDYTKDPGLFRHFVYPLKFLLNNCISVLGLFLILWPFYNRNKTNISLNAFQWQFLIFMGLGPIILSLLLCAITGDNFTSRWSTPYYFSLGILVLAILKPQLTKKNILAFAISLVILSALLFLGRMSTLVFFKRSGSDAFLPNKQIASTLSTLWHKHYSTPLPFLAGSHYLVATVTPYMNDNPKPYLSWKHSASSWINVQDIHRNGGLFIWDEGKNYLWDADSIARTHIPKSVIREFPKLQFLPNLNFFRTSDNQPVVIGVAILPPNS